MHQLFENREKILFSYFITKLFIMKKILNVSLIFLFFLGFSCEDDGNGNGDNDELKQMEEDVLVLINAYRVDTLQMSSLTMNSFIREECRTHSENMADGTVPVGHEGVTERSARIKEELGLGIIAENVSVGANSAEAVVNSWLNSSAHKANIEGDYDLTGVGIAKDSNGLLYFTQIFYKAAK